MKPNKKWYVILIFFVWIQTNCAIITWSRLRSVINLQMFTKLTTGCVSTGDGGIFFFGPSPHSFQRVNYLQHNFWRGQGESHEPIWFLASGLIGEGWPHKLWKLQSSGFGDSTPRRSEGVRIYTDYYRLLTTIKRNETAIEEAEYWHGPVYHN